MPASSESRIIYPLSRNLSWNFAGQILAKFSLLLFHILFANLVGAKGYGEFSFVFVAGVIILQPSLDMRLNQLITKWISRGNTEVIRNSFQIKSRVSIVLLPLVILLGWWYGIHPILLGTILIYFLINTIQQSLFGILRGLGDLRPESITLALQNLLALTVLWIFFNHEINEPWVGSLVLMLTRCAGTILVTGIIWKKYLLKLNNYEHSKTLQSTSNLWQEALTLGLVLFLIQFYFRIDTIMLGLLSSKTEVGLYSVAFNLMEGTFFIPSIVMAAIFPGLSQTKQFLNYFRKGLLMLSLTGIAVGGAVFLFAEIIIQMFFAQEFQGSGEVLKILALAIPIIFWGYLMTQSLVALDHNRIYLGITAFAVLLNVLLNYWLIPEYGAEGAAIATVITEALIPLSCFLMILKHYLSNSTTDAN